MNHIRVSENFVPISEFKAQAADWLKAIAEDHAPVVVTQNGRPAAVVLSPRAYDALIEQARFVASVHEGLTDADAGQVVEHEAAAARLRARFPR
jgi:prevent-host-death family protein